MNKIITKEMLCKRYAERLQDKRMGSKPKELFIFDKDDYDCGCFNPDNWNSGQDIIRYISYYLYENLHTELKFHVDDDGIKYKIELALIYNDDQWTFHVVIKNINDSITGILTETWYKNRGRTEAIYYNGL